MDTHKKFNDIIVREIRLKRIQMGLTQSELAKKVKISPIVYSHIETGRREIKIPEFYILCKYLEISQQAILNYADTHLEDENHNGDYNLKGKIVGFTSFKGGVGVSTLVTLYCNKISSQYKVLLIDATPQLSCYRMRQIDLKRFTDIIPPYDIKAVELDNVANFIDNIKYDYDYIVLDLPRFFYFENNLEDIFLRCNHVFSPFHLTFHSSTKDCNEYMNHIAGRFDLFVELYNKIHEKNNDITFSLISFGDDIPIELKEWINDFNISILPQIFQKHIEFQTWIFDTVTDLSKNEDIKYAPYIDDTLKLIYYLEEETDANYYIEDQHKLRKMGLKNIMI